MKGIYSEKQRIDNVVILLEHKWCFTLPPAVVNRFLFYIKIKSNIEISHSRLDIPPVILTRIQENHVGNIPGTPRPPTRVARSHWQLGLPASLQRHHNLHVRLLSHCIGKTIRRQSNRLHSHKRYSRGKQIFQNDTAVIIGK